MGGNCRTHQQKTEHVPVEHALIGSMGSRDAQLDRLVLKLFRDICHPLKRIDEKVWYALEIGNMILLRLVSQNFIYFVLQAAGHVKKQENPGGEKIDESYPESSAVRMSESHFLQITCQPFLDQGKEFPGEIMRIKDLQAVSSRTADIGYSQLVGYQLRSQKMIGVGYDDD